MCVFFVIYIFSLLFVCQ